MLKLVLAVLVVAVAVLFAMVNMHHVEMHVGRPVHVRLFFLLLTSFLVGCLSTVLVNLYRSAKSKQKRETAQDAKGDVFFSE